MPNERELEQRWPAIPWREPMRCHLPGASGLACRYCILQFGLKGGETDGLFTTSEAFREHLEKEHPQ